MPQLLYPQGKTPGTHWIGVWVGPRVCLDDVEKRKILTLPELELRPLSHPAHSQPLYRLCYPSFKENFTNLIYKYTGLKYLSHILLLKVEHNMLKFIDIARN
jgi:hypothetical protein